MTSVGLGVVGGGAVNAGAVLVGARFSLLNAMFSGGCRNVG